MRPANGARQPVRFAVAALALGLLGEPAFAAPPGSVKFPDAAIEPVAFADLEGWAADDHAAAFATFSASCKPIMRRLRTPREPRPIFGALRAACRRGLAAKPRTARDARTFFEENFRPVRIAKLGEAAGFLTGYYEPIVDGSRVRTPEFPVPMYRRPADLVMLGARRGEGFANRGTVVRKFGRRKAVPYYDRGQIEAGALEGRRLEICWVKDSIEAMFIQIQGSARIRLADGSMLRLNYDAHNGHPYTAVGRILIERGLVPREEMSMERIRQWMLDHPDDAPELRKQNRSFVFFRTVNLADKDEPVGAQGIALAPGRSIAVDRIQHVYGTPFWIDADLPLEERGTSKFRRLMVAQDTGSAIIGPARADLYFGAGDEAGRVAGRIRHPGRFVMLIPRDIDPVEAGKRTPMPRAKPIVKPTVAPAEASAPASPLHRRFPRRKG